MRPFSTTVTMHGRMMVAAGYAPFLTLFAGDGFWMVAGRDYDNCVAHLDGIRAVFTSEDVAVLLCQELNRQAAQ